MFTVLVDCFGQLFKISVTYIVNSCSGTCICKFIIWQKSFELKRIIYMYRSIVTVHTWNIITTGIFSKQETAKRTFYSHHAIQNIHTQVSLAKRLKTIISNEHISMMEGNKYEKYDYHMDTWERDDKAYNRKDNHHHQPQQHTQIHNQNRRDILSRALNTYSLMFYDEKHEQFQYPSWEVALHICC
jgi:hypothetical protein